MLVQLLDDPPGGGELDVGVPEPLDDVGTALLLGGGALEVGALEVGAELESRPLEEPLYEPDEPDDPEEPEEPDDPEDPLDDPLLDAPLLVGAEEVHQLDGHSIWLLLGGAVLDDGTPPDEPPLDDGPDDPEEPDEPEPLELGPDDPLAEPLLE